MNTYITSKNKTIHFEDVKLLTISTMPHNKRLVDRARVVLESGEVELFDAEVKGFNRAWAKWQHNKK